MHALHTLGKKLLNLTGFFDINKTFDFARISRSRVVQFLRKKN